MLLRPGTPIARSFVQLANVERFIEQGDCSFPLMQTSPKNNRPRRVRRGRCRSTLALRPSLFVVWPTIQRQTLQGASRVCRVQVPQAQPQAQPHNRNEGATDWDLE